MQKLLELISIALLGLKPLLELVLIVIPLPKGRGNERLKLLELVSIALPGLSPLLELVLIVIASLKGGTMKG